jgi:hypothetical protein
MKQNRRELWAATKQQVEPEEASQMLEVIPPERRFLLYYRDTQLDRDLERYRLYTHEGLRFRAVALILGGHLKTGHTWTGQNRP